MAQPVTEKRYLKTSTAMAAALIATLATPLNAQESTADGGVFTMLGRLVFGAGSERVAIDVPQAVTVLNQDDFDREQATTVGDVLERIPGVSTVGSESPWGESFNIRGIGSGGSADEPRIVMLIDGVGKYYEQYRLGSLFTEPEFFKRVEVLRGPSSSTLYGSGAIAGVIAMETKDASDFLEGDDTFAARQRLQFTGNGNGRLSSTILAFAPNDSFEALLGYNYRTSDIVEGGDGQLLTGTEGTSRAFIAKGTLRFGDANEHSLEASVVRNTSFVNDQVYNLVDATTTVGHG
ncbi:TonB-dependent receptor plug domain-containing protein [Halocynthiibacter namhaensis]|uniref:TonB-dependent receptor plug domain-containing protein n=1 Tax=Halocynthiibacter namhaensis TaxID=1290553 RepID=UPI00138E2EEC|nr:TonB-dependent receptor plug domain-containing protein [Halocynthiibacter namhaensis]